MNQQDNNYLKKWVDVMSRMMGKRQLKTAIGAEILGFEFRTVNSIPVELSEKDNRTMKFKSIKIIFPTIDNKEKI